MCVCDADVSTKRKVLSLGNYNAVIVVDMTDKQKYLTSELMCVCVSVCMSPCVSMCLHVSPSACQWVVAGAYDREQERKRG